MKKITVFALGLLACFVCLTSCDEGFDDLNTNKIRPIMLDPGYLLNNAIINASFAGQTLPYEIAIVQQIVSPNGGVLAGGNFNENNRAVTIGNWIKYYRDVLKHTTDVKQMTAEDADRSNLYHMARIWHSLGVMILTDTYGDIPYTEAGLGFLEKNVTPQYDPQQEIYQDILTELEEASAALNENGTIEDGDVLYGGDITKWKRLGYSLMLRAAMRHSKVAPSVAADYVATAVAGGVMQSNEDNAVIRHDFNYTNAIGNTLNATEANNYYLTAPFVNYMSDNDDPRLGAIAVRYIGATSGPDQNSAIAGDAPDHVQLSTNPEDQIGMPMGYDNATITSVVTSLGLASFYDFSQLDRTRIGKRDAPAYLVTYAQTQLLLAEAVIRGWTQGDEEALYEAGIRGHMEQMADFDAGSAIAEDAIQAYIDAHPLETSTALEQINTQYWVASFLNGPEAFANFRRSGFPALAPNPYPGSEINGDFIRRLTYPDSELSVNNTNVQQAISRQGADNLETRVWWDVE